MRTGMSGTSIALLGLLLVSGLCLVPVAAEIRVGPVGSFKGEHSFEARCPQDEFVLVIGGRQSDAINSIQLGCATATLDGYVNTTTLGPFGGEGGTAVSSGEQLDILYPWAGGVAYVDWELGTVNEMQFFGLYGVTEFNIGQKGLALPEELICPQGFPDQVMVGVFGTYGTTPAHDPAVITQLGLICDTVKPLLGKKGSGNDDASAAKSLGNRRKQSIRASHFIRVPQA